MYCSTKVCKCNLIHKMIAISNDNYIDVFQPEYSNV